MSSSKQCLKCGQSTAFTGLEPQSCQHCGAVYKKVEEALRSGPVTRPLGAAVATAAEAEAEAAPRRTQGNAHSTNHIEFAELMRAESIYPAFRTVVNVLYWVGIALALIILIAGFVTTAKLSMGPGPAIGGIVTAVILYIIFRVTKEMSLMLADLSDATVRMAARQEAQVER